MTVFRGPKEGLLQEEGDPPGQTLIERGGGPNEKWECGIKIKTKKG